jgi:hypothetical protein
MEWQDLPIKAITLDAWRSTYESFKKMPKVIAASLAFASAFDLLSDSVNKSWPAPLMLFLLFALLLLSLAAMVPASISIHRSILLNENNDRYFIQFAKMRTLKFFLIFVLLFSFIIFPSIFVYLFDNVFIKIGGMLIIVITSFFSFRFVLAFPYAALDGETFSIWRSLLAKTEGYGWSIFWIMVFVSFPIKMTWILISYLELFSGSAEVLFGNMIDNIVALFLVSAASHIFKHLPLETPRV